MSEEIPAEHTANYEIFRDILSSFLIERIAIPYTKPKPKPKRRSKKDTTPSTTSPPPVIEDTASDADDLADFTSYIATAVFLTLPEDLQSLAHHKWSSALQAQYPLPLTREQTANLLQTLDPSIPDSLTTYGLTSPTAIKTTTTSTTTPSNLPTPTEFLTPILTSYITTATTPPPPPSSTRSQTTACEICGRDWINLSYHHLIPRMVHAKVVKRGWHRADELQNVAWLCGACHRFVHRFRGHEALAREFFTVERLLEAEEVRRFAEWVGRVRWKAQ